MKAMFYRHPVSTAAAFLCLLYAALGCWRLSPYGTGFEGSDSYSRIAAYIVENGSFPTSFRPPLYPLFLATCMSLAEANWEMLAVALQGLMAVGLGALLVAASYRLSGSALTSLVALVLFVSNFLYQFEVMAKRETVFFTFALVCCLTAFLFIANVRKRYSTMAFSAAIALLLRPNAITLIPLILLYAVLDRKQGKASLWALLLPAVMFALMLLPWQLFVYQQTGTFPVTTSTNSGQTLWKGNNPFLLTVWPKADIDIVEQTMSDGLGGADINTPQSDAVLKQQASAYMKANPARTIKNAAVKAGLFFAPFPIPLGTGKFELPAVGPDVPNELDGVQTGALTKYRYRNKAILLLATLHAAVVWLGFIGFLFIKGKDASRTRIAWAGGALVLMLLAVHTLTYPETRYRWPLDIFLIIPAAEYLARLVRSTRGGGGIGQTLKQAFR